jgi:hypothetical protein
VLIAFATNLIGAGVVISFGGAASGGLNTDLIDEGFVLGCYFALACWIALGSAELAHLAGRVPWGRLSPAALSDRARLADRGVFRVLAPVAVVALGAALVLPLVLGNWSTVHRSSHPYADRYAQSVFAELPHRAVLFILGAELTQPMIYRQVVYHDRPDVVVVAVDGLTAPWYREELSRRLGFQIPSPTGGLIAGTTQIMDAVARSRPTFVDPQAGQALQKAIGYRPVGLVAQLVPGHGQMPVSSPSALEQTMLQAERNAGFPNHDWNVWPNDFVDVAEYSTAALNVARAYYQHHDLTGMGRALHEDLRVLPNNPPAVQDLSLLSANGAGG